jgi:predicted Fe-S protein YdhL (DUF1289 family)
MIDIILPIKISSPANGSHGHWAADAKRRKDQRTIVKWSLLPLRKPPLPVVVTLTRIGVRDLDTDNLAAGFKSIRDEVAAWLGCGDSTRDPVIWRYEQERGEPRQYACRIKVESNI